MSRVHGTGKVPADLATPGTGSWPDCEVDPENRAAVVALRVSLLARNESEQRGQRALAQAAGLSHTTLARVIGGTIWPTIATVAALEAACGQSFWPEFDS